MKKVFVLGAGFSMDAGAPSQAQIMKEIFDYGKKNNFTSKNEEEKFSKFKDLITNRMHVNEQQASKVKLEDIFTPLDSCLSNNAQFRGMNTDEIIKAREAVFYFISKIIHLTLKGNINKNYINDFAKYLTEKSKIRSKKNLTDRIRSA